MICKDQTLIKMDKLDELRKGLKTKHSNGLSETFDQNSKINDQKRQK